MSDQETDEVSSKDTDDQRRETHGLWLTWFAVVVLIASPVAPEFYTHNEAERAFIQGVMALSSGTAAIWGLVHLWGRLRRHPFLSMFLILSFSGSVLMIASNPWFFFRWGLHVR